MTPGATTGSIHIGANGKVGIGTDPATAFTPYTTLLNIKGSAPGDALVKVQNTAGGGYSGLEFSDNAGTPRFFFGVQNTTPAATRLNSFNSTPFILMTNTQRRLQIEAGGNIGLGCTNAAARLVIGSGASSGDVDCSATPRSAVNPGDTTFTTSSSRSSKVNISPVEVEDILGRMAGIDVFTFDFKNGPRNRMGLMAEDFQAVFGRGRADEINGQEVMMALWLAVRDLAARNAELQERLDSMEANLKAERSRDRATP